MQNTTPALLMLALLVFSPAMLTAQDTGNESTPLKPGETATAPPAAEDSAPNPLRDLPNNAFTVGEKLNYLIRYGPIVAGNSQLSVPEIVNVQGSPGYHIISEARSNSLFSRFYKVDDRVESFMDVRGLYSLRQIKRLREGGYKEDFDIIYDQRRHLAISKKDTSQVPPFVQDVLSALYYVRTLEIAPGDTISIDHHAGKNVYPLLVIVHKRERVSVKAGRFDCLVVEPVLRSAGLFKHRGRVIIHLTDDRYKIPVMMTSQISVKSFDLGSVVAELEKMEGVPGR